MIRGEHVGLRAIEPGDLETLRAWRNRPEMRQFYREFKEFGPDKQRAWYDAKVVNDPSTLMFAIVDLENDELIGASGLCFIDWVNRNCDLSLYIGRDELYIDDRFAPDAARATLRYGFEVLGIHRVWVEIYEYDTAKQTWLEDLGFSLDGRFREHHFHDGKWHDSLFYSLLDREFIG